jgi:hypothetical protein
MLRYRGQHMDCQPVRLRQVRCNKVHARFHEVGDEGDVAGEPVELSNDQGGTMEPACCERPRQLGTVVPLACLYLGEVFKEPAAAQVVLHRYPLCFQAEPTAALACC